MNTLFTLKARVILLSLLICQLGLKVKATSNTYLARISSDTTIAKKADTAHVMKVDTTLIIKAGATIVKRSDTTLVINGDTALINKITKAAGAKTDSAASKKADPAVTIKTDPATTPNSGAAKTDPATTTNTGAAKTDPATSATTDDGLAKTTTIGTPVDGTIQVRNTATAPPVDGLIEVRNSTGQILVKDAPQSTVIKVDSAATQKLDNTTAKDQTPAPVKDVATTTAAKDVATTTTTPAQDNNVPPVNTDAAAKKADPATTTTSTDTTLAKKTDTTLVKKPDTLLANKTDTTLLKKSDTTLVQKDTTTAITEIKAQSVFLEVGGAGLAISGNYDTRLNKQRNGWGYRIGAGYFASGGNTVFSIPFQINYLIGEHSHMIEFGAGTTFLNSTGTNVGNSKWEFDKITGFIATATIGYRFQPAHSGINFRLAFVPILYDEGIIPAGGVSIGYTFK
ncbi:MAG: hypothetical protein ACXVB0_00710 [Mucilaginibacter sp.]